MISTIIIPFKDIACHVFFKMLLVDAISPACDQTLLCKEIHVVNQLWTWRRRKQSEV